MFNRVRHATTALLVCAAATIGTAQHVEAATVVGGTVFANSVDYIFFDFSGGALQINVDGVSLSDPMVSLFLDDGSAVGNLTGTILGTNDDGGTGLNSQLSLLLADDSYVLAVGSWFLRDTEARSGIASSPSSDGTYTATFNQNVDLAAVPLPAGLPLMLVGLGAFGIARRRKTAA